MKLSLPLSPTETATAELGWARCLGTLDVADVPEVPNRDEAIRNAIEHPIGLEKNIHELFRAGETVAIIVSDASRQTCVAQILPILFDGLRDVGIPKEDISIVFATGVHRPPRPEEQALILGPELHRNFKGRILCHDPRDEAGLVYLGTTSRGTPIRINRHVYECDRKIVTGSVVLHYFAGFGGGPKAVVPGIAALDTIAHNHSLNLDPHGDRLDPAVQIGALDGNPVAEDILEAARPAGVDYLINTVLNRRSEIAGIFAGELKVAHRAAARFAWGLYAVPITVQADLVVAASTGTRDFVQTHKALFNAYQAVKPGGHIVLITPCEEGLGGESFVKWLRRGNRAAIMAGLREQAEINGQTALSTIEKAPLAILVTQLSEAEVALLGARKAPTPDAAIELARDDLAARHDAHELTYYLMPSAAHTVPILTPQRGADI